MKNLFTICFALFLLGSCANSQSQSKEVIVSVDAKKFRELVESGNGTVLDVRTQEECDAGYIAGAKIIDIYLEGFEEKVKQLPKDKEVYVYCRAGRRSMDAAKILEKNGFTKVYNLQAGINEWNDSGFPLVK